MFSSHLKRSLVIAIWEILSMKINNHGGSKGDRYLWLPIDEAFEEGVQKYRGKFRIGKFGREAAAILDLMRCIRMLVLVSLAPFLEPGTGGYKSDNADCGHQTQYCLELAHRHISTCAQGQARWLDYTAPGSVRAPGSMTAHHSKVLGISKSA
ncbi:hypothetical protein BDV23DRAFT_133202 [Aspergillus alliaceus]|uniref:Uncharacterized protein n=1 Tax=Petromyces alliaceus TaxID=209559 RepID=A0A5N7BYK6_PETAA|nr:hypothetical protein BDV23DRAFT_133202 [Aspergillus alliaceus]